MSTTNVDIVCLVVGALLLMVPVVRHTVEELNRPKVVTHHRFFNDKGELIRYHLNQDGNVTIMKTGKYLFGSKKEEQ